MNDEDKPPSQAGLYCPSGHISTPSAMDGRLPHGGSATSILAGLRFLGGIGYFGRLALLVDFSPRSNEEIR